MLLTLADVAQRLQITEKAVRRRLERGGFADLRVVRMGRTVRVASEDLDAWICRKGEIGGARERATVSMHISAPPYTYDRTRRHVSIHLEHPRTHAPVRKRLVTPFACDEAAGLTWGRQQAVDLIERLMRGESETPTEHSKPRAKPRDIIPVPTSPTLAELWTLYHEDRARLRPGTRRVNEARWRSRIAPLLAEIPVSQIGRLEVVRLRSSLASNEPHFANQVLGLLRRILEFAAERGIITESPTIRAERRARKIAISVPDEADLDALLVAADRLTTAGRFEGTDLVLMVLLGLDGGLRPGEVAGLRWCDVDIARKRIIVRNSRARCGNSDLPPKAGEAGAVYLTTRLLTRLASADRGDGRGYVCWRSCGRPLDTIAVSKRVAEIHKEAGLPIRRGHWLRHCAASRLIAAGESLAATSKHLRHSNLEVTQRYVHSVIGHDPGPAAANALDRRINVGGKTAANDGN